MKQKIDKDSVNIINCLGILNLKTVYCRLFIHKCIFKLGTSLTCL